MFNEKQNVKGVLVRSQTVTAASIKIYHVYAANYFSLKKVIYF